MSLPKISIIVPSYNQGLYLEETILSIINQQYPNLELIVIDGGSTDISIDIIRKYEQYITWWVSERDNGQSHAINKGLKKISGEIVTWINSDDLLLPGSLLSVANYFLIAPADIGLIHGGTIMFKKGKELYTDWGYNNPSLERYLSGMAFSQPSAFFLKKYLDQVGKYVSEDLHYGMDYDLFCRLACVCKFAPVKDIFSKYRLHDASKSESAQEKFINDWHFVIFNLFKNLGWDAELTELKEAYLTEQEQLAFYYPYSFTPDKNIFRNVDRKKILFYHYCYTLKSCYQSGKIVLAKRISKHIWNQFPDEWRRIEKGIPEIMSRLVFPVPVIQWLKYLRRKI